MLTSGGLRARLAALLILSAGFAAHAGCATGGSADEHALGGSSGSADAADDVPNAGTGGTTGGTGGGGAGATGGTGPGTGGSGGAFSDASPAGAAGLAGAAGQPPDAGEADADAAGDAECPGALEICNGLDDDCDGLVDEDNPNGNTPCQLSTLRGVCRNGVTQCANGFVRCAQSVQPTVELCNGLDDDCDGEIDEDNPGGNQSCDTEQPGLCAVGAQRCNGGIIECVQTQTPVAETCNGLDDDCDGVPDNGFSGSGEPCVVKNVPVVPGTPCARGLTNCLGGQDNCTQVVKPALEQCDGEDNDCDGTVDNPAALDGKSCPTFLPGLCATGRTECNAGELDCVPLVPPGSVVETCNGADDDCDGEVDNVAALGLECATKHSLAQNVQSWRCTTGLCEVASCNAPYADCDGAPGNGCESDTDTNAVHCGACGKSCSAVNGTRSCAAGACQIACNPGWGDCDNDTSNGCERDLRSDIQNCGACERRCNSTNGTPSCANGVCGLSCSADFGDCNGSAADGCETATSTSSAHCGACGRACSSAGGVPICAAGQCSITCTPGFGDCDGNAATGCERDLRSDVQNCGACGKACNATNGTATCASGACGITCAAGFADCNGNPADGCEVNLRADPGNCNACGAACGSANGTASCSAGVCAIACSAGFDNCDGSTANGCETNLKTDAAHCNACGTACNTTNGTASCNNGICSIACATGWGNCSGGASDGCETNLNSVQNCGSCGNVCPSQGGTPSCSGGQCSTLTCDPDRADCDGSSGNGCETDITTVTNCGGCGIVCSANNGARACVGQACTITCNPGFANCDNDLTNGCEAIVSNDPLRCGTCNNVCNSTNGTASCSNGVCAIACNAGFGNCNGNAADGCETNTNTNATHCGGCGQNCTSSNGSAACIGGTCTISCNVGFGNCNGSAADGCEVNLSTTTAHCGGCDQACSSANGTAACDGGQCSVACSSGFGDCDGNARSNGCESNLATSTNACGNCATQCTNPNGSTQCLGGVCTPACAPSFQSCDGNPINGCETNVSTNVSHCGSCGAGCSNANGSHSCVGGQCVISCNAGFANCDDNARDNGCEVNTTNNPGHCNGCGAACPAPPNGVAVCSGSACSFNCASGFVKLGSRCATFGGAFSNHGSLKGCLTPACYTANPYTGACSCPAGFTASGPIEMLDDRSCPPTNPPFGWQNTHACSGGSFTANSDFGGAYHRYGGTCFVGNPYTGGGCSCPAGTVAIELIADHACWNDTHVGFCWNPNAPLSTFGGAFQRSDSTSYGAGGCVVGNPATGACSCPGGTTAIPIRNIYGPGNAGCQRTGAFGSNLYVCHVL